MDEDILMKLIHHIFSMAGMCQNKGNLLNTNIVTTAIIFFISSPAKQGITAHAGTRRAHLTPSSKQSVPQPAGAK